MSNGEIDQALSDDEMYRRVYQELKRIASHHLRAVDRSATLSTTELVHESYLKLQAARTPIGRDAPIS
jgi:hypothetical protein